MNDQDSANPTPQPTDPNKANQADQPEYMRPQLDAATGMITSAELRYRRTWFALGFLADAGLIALPRLTDVRPSEQEAAFRTLQYDYEQVLSMLKFFDGAEGED